MVIMCMLMLMVLTNDNTQRSVMKYVLKIQNQIQKKTNPAKSYEKYTALVIAQDHTGRLKYSQHDAKSHGYTGVYVCRV